jgi:prepilin-type processing-associated H-X9-DG protein
MYAGDSDDFLPVCNWPPNANPWRTYEVFRVAGGTGRITEGPYNLGYLFATEIISDAKVFYCPSGEKVSRTWTYGYYTESDTWPSTPAGSDDDNIRIGYNYYPQSRELEPIGRGLELPKIARKQNELDMNRSMTVDLLHDVDVAPHRDRGIAGLNALFGDGHVAFQNARANPEAFDSELWTDIGANAFNFRRAMASWQP